MRAASIRFFDGRHPRFTHVPPTVRDSVMTAVLPSSAAFNAAAKAVDPDPRITRSYRSDIMVTDRDACGALSGRPPAQPPPGGGRETREPERPPAERRERGAQAGRRDRDKEQRPAAADHDRDRADDRRTHATESFTRAAHGRLQESRLIEFSRCIEYGNTMRPGI